VLSPEKVTRHESSPMLRISAQEFAHLPLRVHGFLADVPLHDVWAFDLPRTRSGITLDEFLRAEKLHQCRLSPSAPALLSVRLSIGRLFGWDRAPVATPCETFATRMTTVDCSKTLVPTGTPEGLSRVVYRFENEQLLELINRTAHAAAVSALVETAKGYRFYFGVYVPQRQPLYASVHAPDRPVPQAYCLSVTAAHGARDLGHNVRRGLTRYDMIGGSATMKSELEILSRNSDAAT
jgi:Protein of unknown function (DUF2867)